MWCGDRREVDERAAVGCQREEAVEAAGVEAITDECEVKDVAAAAGGFPAMVDGAGADIERADARGRIGPLAGDQQSRAGDEEHADVLPEERPRQPGCDHVAAARIESGQAGAVKTADAREGSSDEEARSRACEGVNGDRTTARTADRGMPGRVDSAAREDVRERDPVFAAQAGEAATDKPTVAAVGDGCDDRTVPGYLRQLAAGGGVDQHDRAVVSLPAAK